MAASRYVLGTDSSAFCWVVVQRAACRRCEGRRTEAALLDGEAGPITPAQASAGDRRYSSLRHLLHIHGVGQTRPVCLSNRFTG